MSILGPDFYHQNACLVARQLLGATLVRIIDGERVSGKIVETEAYTGRDDLASHGRAGRTPRNLPMWEAPGHAYVYLTYGMYWLLNVVCEPADQPAAVLIRALEPLEGLDIIARNRVGRKPTEWTSGPGRLTMALEIGQAENRVDMTTPDSDLWIENGQIIPEELVLAGPRVGLGKNVSEPWFTMPWRWWVKDNDYVS